MRPSLTNVISPNSHIPAIVNPIMAKNSNMYKNFPIAVVASYNAMIMTTAKAISL